MKFSAQFPNVVNYVSTSAASRAIALVLCNMMHIQMLSEAAPPPCPLTGRTYTARAATCGLYYRLIIAVTFSAARFTVFPASLCAGALTALLAARTHVALRLLM